MKHCNVFQPGHKPWTHPASTAHGGSFSLCGNTVDSVFLYLCFLGFVVFCMQRCTCTQYVESPPLLAEPGAQSSSCSLSAPLSAVSLLHSLPSCLLYSPICQCTVVFASSSCICDPEQNTVSCRTHIHKCRTVTWHWRDWSAAAMILEHCEVRGGDTPTSDSQYECSGAVVLCLIGP